MADGAIHEISEHLGRLTGDIAGLRDIIVAHHVEADRRWDGIDNRLATLEQKDSSRRDALSRMGAKLRPLEALPKKIDGVDKRLEGMKPIIQSVGGIDTRLRTVERMVNRAVGIAAAIGAMGSIAGYLITHYGGQLLRWMMGRS